MKAIILFLLFTWSGVLFGQLVYTVDYQSQADVKVFVVKYESQADLKIFKVKYKSQAGENDGNWFWVDYESQAQKKLFFCRV